jgi:FMN phosphatase YigB (HAD superfamily)
MLKGGVCFFFDVDNTLLDNDRFAADLGARLEEDFGAAECRRYWEIFNALRDELGYADYLGSLQSFRTGLHDHPRLLCIAEHLLEYPFPRLLYPSALAAVSHAGSLGTAAVLSDGDVVFQPRKVRRIWDAVDGRVLIYVHKERSLADLQARFPADHYVMIDDKANLLAAAKRILGPRLTTVFVRQGHYATAAAGLAAQPAPDRVVDRIGDFVRLHSSDFEVSP